MLEIGDKRVFVTGGASGIGRAILEALLAKRAKVLFCDVNADAGKGLETELRKQYGADRVIFAQCDVTNAQQLEDVFQTAVSSLGGLDVCVNNAGILDERIWETMLAVNTTAQIRGCKLALEHMRRDKGGRGGVIINTVSIAGLSPGHELPVYIASKHAMIGYTTSCARDPEVTAQGVRWCCLCPMPVNTGMLQLKEGQVKTADQFMQKMQPFMIEPEDVVKAFMTLVQDTENNGSMMVVNKVQGGVYKRRMLVDDDGQSNPMLIDKPLTAHPPVPGPSQ